MERSLVSIWDRFFEVTGLPDFRRGDMTRSSATAPSEYSVSWKERYGQWVPYKTSFITPGTPASCDVVVIGGGLAGLNTALSLLERGRSVIVVEANTIGSNASGRNGGMAIAGFAAEPEDWMGLLKGDPAKRESVAAVHYGLTTAAVKTLKDRIYKYKIPCDAAPAPSVTASLFPSRLADAAEGVEWMNDTFNTRLRLLSKDDLTNEIFRGRDGAAHPYAFGIVDDDAFAVNPLKLCFGLAAAITNRAFAAPRAEHNPTWLSGWAGAAAIAARLRGGDAFSAPVVGRICEGHQAVAVAMNPDSVRDAYARRLRVDVMLPPATRAAAAADTSDKRAHEPDGVLADSSRNAIPDATRGLILCDNVVSCTAHHARIVPSEVRSRTLTVWTWALSTTKSDDGARLFGYAGEPAGADAAAAAGGAKASWWGRLLGGSAGAAAATGGSGADAKRAVRQVMVCDDRNLFSWYRSLPDGRLLWGGGCGAADFRTKDGALRMLLSDMSLHWPALARDVAVRNVGGNTPGAALSHVAPSEDPSASARWRDPAGHVAPDGSFKAASKEGVKALWGGMMGWYRDLMPGLGVNSATVGRYGQHVWWMGGFGGHGIVPTVAYGDLVARVITSDDADAEVTRAYLEHVAVASASFHPRWVPPDFWRLKQLAVTAQIAAFRVADAVGLWREKQNMRALPKEA